MALTEWFDTVELESPTPSQQALLGALEKMLQAYEPPFLDRSRSHIKNRGHAWTKADTIEIRLAHNSEPDAAIEVGLSSDEAIVGWLTAHEHIDEREVEGGDRPWPVVVVDAVAGILRGDYEVEDTYKGRRLIKTRVLDAGNPGDPRLIMETGSLFGWVPTPGSKRIERRRIGFGVQQPH